MQVGIPVCVLVLSIGAGVVLAQATEYKLGDEGAWVEQAGAEPGSDAWTIAEARRMLAEGRAGAARSMLKTWIDANLRSESPYLAEAYLLRGDTWVASSEEYEALFDYETVIKDFPASDSFMTALEREFAIGEKYINGFRRKWLGMRIDDATSLGVELLMRVQERAPGSALAERAAITLADHFYRVRELKLASEMYEIVRINYPDSEYKLDAMLRQVYSNIGRFKGPSYNSAGLIEARALIDDFQVAYPGEAEQAGIDDSLAARIDESLAAQGLDTARWYLRRGDWASARLALRRLIARHPETVASTRAQEIMTERGWEHTPPFRPAVAHAEEATETAPEGDETENAPDAEEAP